MAPSSVGASSIARVRALERAAETTASSSAPLKLSASFAIARTSISSATVFPCRWHCNTSTRPGSSGRPSSTWSSSRPGRRTAGSSRSGRFVVATRSTLLSAVTPSSLARKELTTLSPTGDCPPPPSPRLRNRASASSRTITWSGEACPSLRWSTSASAKMERAFSSLCPTKRLSISGPDTTFGGRSLRALLSCRATSVLPVPGGPWKRTPRTCLSPRFSASAASTVLEASTRRRSGDNVCSSPPTPRDAKKPPASTSFSNARACAAASPGPIVFSGSGGATLGAPAGFGAGIARRFGASGFAASASGVLLARPVPVGTTPKEAAIALLETPAEARARAVAASAARADASIGL
mmetsp:Transcript_28058/g.91719  ORF Transcript_28058/g.91719 Transcript_28058/m.91719 type:complete len:353 (-) Transcript_28058:12-1070(-)